MLRALNRSDHHLWWIAAGITVYLAAFLLAWKLGFMYAVPLLLLLPVIGWYLFETLLKPVLILVPMIGATYLGDVARLIPDGVIPLTLFQVFLILGILIFFLHYLLHSDQKFRILGIEMELLLLLTLISFSILYSPNRESALLNLSRILFLIIFAYLIVNIIKERVHYYYIYGLLIVIAIILGIMSIYSSLLDPVITILNLQAGGTRVFGRGAITVEDPNVFATLFFLPVACTTSVFLSQKSLLWRFPALFVTLILLAGLASTYSRSAWISTALLLLILVIYYRQYKMMFGVFALVIFVILSIPELRDMTTLLINRLFDIFSGITDDSSRIRLLLGIAAVHMFFDSGMMGVGFRGFPELFTNYFTTQQSIGVVEPHNIIYEILAELGIIGFGLVLFIAIAIFRNASQHVRSAVTESDKIIATTLMGSLVAFIVFFQLYGGALVSSSLWAIIGLVFAQNFYRENQHPET